MKTELASLVRQLGTLEAFARRYPMSAALAERTHPGRLYHADESPAVSLVIARGWTGENAEQALAEAAELFGRDGWKRVKHAAADSRDFHWTKELQGVRVSLLYAETAGDIPHPEHAHRSPVPPECFPRLQPAEPLDCCRCEWPKLLLQEPSRCQRCLKPWRPDGFATVGEVLAGARPWPECLPAPEIPEPHNPTLTDAAEAVLLFHSAGPWTEEKRQRWQQLTGAEVATTATLCDTCRAALKGGRA